MSMSCSKLMYHKKNPTHLKALVSAASESNSTDADVHPAASLADAKNNTLTVSGAILYRVSRRATHFAQIRFRSNKVDVFWRYTGH